MSAALRPPAMKRSVVVDRLVRALAIAASVLAALVLAVVAYPAGALADTVGTTDCAQPLPIEKAVASAELVFVGTVVASNNGGRSATVTVTEIWHGDVPSEVTVNGGKDPTNPAEDDRTFEVGTTYLFLPVLAGDVLVDSVCSSTTAWSNDLAAMRPPEARLLGGVAKASPGPLAFLGSFAGPLAMAGLIGGGVIGFSFLVARRRDA